LRGNERRTVGEEYVRAMSLAWEKRREARKEERNGKTKDPA